MGDPSEGFIVRVSTPVTPGSRLSGLPLRTRLLAAFLVVSLASLVVAGFALTRMSSISARAQAVYDQGTVQLAATRSLQVLWWEYETHDARLAITGLPADVLATEQELQSSSLDQLNTSIETTKA